MAIRHSLTHGQYSPKHESMHSVRVYNKEGRWTVGEIADRNTQNWTVELLSLWVTLIRHVLITTGTFFPDTLN